MHSMETFFHSAGSAVEPIQLGRGCQDLNKSIMDVHIHVKSTNRRPPVLIELTICVKSIMDILLPICGLTCSLVPDALMDRYLVVIDQHGSCRLSRWHRNQIM